MPAFEIAMFALGCAICFGGIAVMSLIDLNAQEEAAGVISSPLSDMAKHPDQKVPLSPALSPELGGEIESDN